jgi:hypothetical protein
MVKRDELCSGFYFANPSAQPERLLHLVMGSPAEVRWRSRSL